jgi:hypothetical protein
MLVSAQTTRSIRGCWSEAEASGMFKSAGWRLAAVDATRSL